MVVRIINFLPILHWVSLKVVYDANGRIVDINNAEQCRKPDTCETSETFVIEGWVSKVKLCFDLNKQLIGIIVLAKNLVEIGKCHEDGTSLMFYRKNKYIEVIMFVLNDAQSFFASYVTKSSALWNSIKNVMLLAFCVGVTTGIVFQYVQYAKLKQKK